MHAARWRCSALAALVAGACTAVAGSVPFVGLVAPHALRPLVGPLRPPPAARRRSWAAPSWWCWPTCVARTLSARIDLPLGSLTAFVGAPYFLLALRGSQGRA